MEPSRWCCHAEACGADQIESPSNHWPPPGRDHRDTDGEHALRGAADPPRHKSACPLSRADRSCAAGLGELRTDVGQGGEDVAVRVVCRRAPCRPIRN